MQARRHQGRTIAATVIMAIKNDLDAGRFANAAIARRYGVSVRTVERIAAGRHVSVRIDQPLRRCAGCGSRQVGDFSCARCEAEAMRQRHARVAVACSECGTPSRDLIFTSAAEAVCPACASQSEDSCRQLIAC